MPKIKDLYQEIKKISALKPFEPFSRQTVRHCGLYKEVIYVIKRINWIIGRFHEKNQGQRMIYSTAFKPFLDRRTDIVACRGAICNQNDVIWFIGS